MYNKSGNSLVVYVKCHNIYTTKGAFAVSEKNVSEMLYYDKQTSCLTLTGGNLNMVNMDIYKLLHCLPFN